MNKKEGLECFLTLQNHWSSRISCRLLNLIRFWKAKPQSKKNKYSDNGWIVRLIPCFRTDHMTALVIDTSRPLFKGSWLEGQRGLGLFHKKYFPFRIRQVGINCNNRQYSYWVGKTLPNNVTRWAGERTGEAFASPPRVYILKKALRYLYLVLWDKQFVRRSSC